MRHVARRLSRSTRSVVLGTLGATFAATMLAVAAPGTAVVKAAGPDTLYISASDTVATCCVNSQQFGFADIGTDLSIPFEIVNDQSHAVKVVGYEPGDGVSIRPGACSPGTSIPRNGRCRGEIAVPFSDSYTTGVEHHWSYRILTDLPGTPRDLVLDGGWAPFEMQEPDLREGWWDMGYAEVGEDGSKAAIVSFAKKDHYDRVIATVTGVSVIGDDPDSFRATINSTWPSSMCDAPDSFVICDVRIVGRPTHTGVNRATVRFSVVDRFGATHRSDVDVSIIGAVGTLQVDGDRTIQIDDAPLFRTLADRTITWRNASDGIPVHVDRVELRDWEPEGDPFLVNFELDDDGCRRVTLEPGEACSVTLGIRTRSTATDSVRVVPVTSASERESASVTVSTAAVGMRADIDDSGRTSLRFGNRPIGSRLSKTVDIVSLGTSALTGIRWEVTGDEDLSLRGDTCAGGSLPPYPTEGSSRCSLTIRYAPTGRGERTATLRVTADGVDPVEVPLSGTGIDPMPLASPSEVAFGTMGPGTFKDATIVVGDRTPPFTVTAVRLAGGEDLPNAIRRDGCTGRTVGDEPCEVVVRYWAIGDPMWSRIEIETDMGTLITIPVTASIKRGVQVFEYQEASDRNLPDPEYLSTWPGETVTGRFWITNVSDTKVRIRDLSIEDHSNWEGVDAPEPVGTFAVVRGSGCLRVYVQPGETCIATVSYTGDEARTGDSDSQLVLHLDDGTLASTYLYGSTYPRSTFTVDAPDVVDLQVGLTEVDKGSPAAASVDVAVDAGDLSLDGFTVSAASPAASGKSGSGTATARWKKRVKARTDTKATTYEVQVRKGHGPWKTVQRSQRMSAGVPVAAAGTDVRVRSRNGSKVSRWTVASVSIGVITDQRLAPKGWKVVKDGGSLGGSLVRSERAGSRLSFRRSWTEVSVIIRPSQSSTFEVWVNGKRLQTVTVAKKTGLRRAVVYQVGYATRKTRRFEIRVRSGTLDIDGWVIKDRVPTP